MLKEDLIKNPQTWAITGVAGFVGSSLLEALLKLNQNVIGIDNFSNSSGNNLTSVQASIKENWSNFTFYEADIRNLDDCLKVCNGADFVLHQAALGSVPRSIKDPLTTNKVTLNSNGLAWRPHLHIEDVCESFRCCIDWSPKVGRLTILNVGQNEDNFKVIDIAKIIKSLLSFIMSLNSFLLS